MTRHQIFWHIIKLLNANAYFRKHITEIDFDYFYVQHPSHFGNKEGYREKVTLVDYDEQKKEMTVKRCDHTNGEKLFIKSVKLSQVFLNAK